ncbi:15-cis-phytoene desaturase, chloroplastic/chromoplastic [Seminavis robusta]|uniref:Amine oxidase n=1 Tax=Seminavis robusta TaxID=568900 RepID=A0A9N8H3K4_9STRA|nr:15-cis-phytoene desaturase, chloroplastic/chromoplastic [Seminavis robusta]|eukprot:Sro41_g025110.1 15-cis-phytoene desaturase, chloroplastic/chromoplastic (576) ;mRNA; r:51642-53457
MPPPTVLYGVIALLLTYLTSALALSSTSRLPTPARIKLTENYKEASALSEKFRQNPATEEQQKTVAIIGGGLSGLACAKYLSDAGHKPIVYEARNVLGGKVSAWQDEDGDWIETGLHIFFGAYPNMMNLFEELDIEDRLQWKPHRMTFAMADKPGQFTSFEFPPGVPAPLNMAAAILTNTEMLTLTEKIRMVPGLLPMLLEGQSFIDAQDELSVLQFMQKYGMPERINQEIFIAMGKALDFIDPDRLSMSVILTAMNRFINEADGSQTAFLDGNQPDRLCQPIVDHIEKTGGQVQMGKPIASIDLNADNSVKGLLCADGSTITADMYVSAMPVDVVKRLIPSSWSTMPYFRQLDELEGIPVVNIQLWFDRKLKALDGLCFSRSPLLSVYADMSVCCEEYASDKASMLELVFAPCSPVAGSEKNWIAASDEEIIDATVKELARLFPTEIGPGAMDGGAKVTKSTVVRVPRSVYAATPGRGKFRPSQESPIDNFVMAGDFAIQKYLGSMEGAVLSGKLAAEVVCDKAANKATKGVRQVTESIANNEWQERIPAGVRGNYPIAFGGGQQGSGATVSHP